MKTKIIATLGPATSSKNILKSLILEGVNVFRINFSHGSHEVVKGIIENIKELNSELETNVAILGDLQGPKIRIGTIAEGERMLNEGDIVDFCTDINKITENQLYINYQEFAKDVSVDENILIDDGKLTLQVISTNKIDTVSTKVIYGGILSSKKGVNLPNTKISLPSITEKDMQDLRFAIENNFHWIALSFVRSAEDILLLKKYIQEYGNTEHKPAIIAKIEKPEGVANIDSIIQATDAIMIARGDLGVEIPMEKVPGIQKMIIKKCMSNCKQVIVATQMMESMITSIRATRAETSDVANAVFDGADAVMLSGETSVGKFPIEVVKAMARIISEVEKSDSLYNKYLDEPSNNTNRFISDSVIDASCQLARESKAAAIVIMTATGYSAARISSQRPKTQLIVIANNNFLAEKLSLLWGVKTILFNQTAKSTTQTLKLIEKQLIETGALTINNLVLHVMSSPVYGRGKTNTLKLNKI